jgi:CRP/FNR family transcriptional regulator, cyclic AMP receptor protein
MAARPRARKGSSGSSGVAIDDDGLDTSAIQALEFAGTCIEGVPPPALARLLVRSQRREIAAGNAIFPVTEHAPRIGLVLMGTARSFLTAADGRQLTVRYARRGALVGKHATIIGAHPPVGVQALTDCTVLELDIDVFGACVATELSISTALNLEFVRRLEDVYAAVGDSAFGTVRQRLVRHLLALAGDEVTPPAHRVTLTQQRLADAIGSSREVVARELAGLRREGLIRSDAGQIELLNVDRLVTSLNSWQVESPY